MKKNSICRKESAAMKTVIVYYSLEGNTDYAAAQIAELLGAELLRLEPVKAYPTGKVGKFFWGGKSAVMAEAPQLQPYRFDAASCERIIFGSPVWASTIAPPLRTFIRENDLKGKKIAAFLCQSGAGAEKAFVKLKNELGIDALEAELVLIDPKSRPNEANKRRITGFCEKLK